MTALGTAYCRNCGNIAMVDEDDLFNEEQKIDLATSNCDCEESTKRRKIIEEINKAKQRVIELFGEECVNLNFEPVKDIKFFRLLDDTIDMVANYKISSVSIDINGETKAKVSRSSKGKINIERAESIKYKLEA